MKLKTTVYRDELSSEGILLAKEETTLEIDSEVESPEEFERIARQGVFVGVLYPDPGGA
jgi:hypothetical protein